MVAHPFLLLGLLIGMMRYHDIKLVVLDEVAAVNEDEPTLPREPDYTAGADRRNGDHG